MNLQLSAFEKAFTAFKTQDVELALKVIEEDTAIDNLEQDINQFAVWLIAKEATICNGSTKNYFVIKIHFDIERIADFAVNIAKATVKIGNTESLLDITHLEKMKEFPLKCFKSHYCFYR